MPIGSMIEKFRPEFEAYIERRREERGQVPAQDVIALGVADDQASPYPTLQPA
jgi:hypothetical protein